jgi:hypothetical protein
MQNPRKEIEFPWGEAVIRSRPTMARVAEIETKFGPAPALARRLINMELSISKELLPLLAIMLRGCEDAPKGDAAIMQQAFELGAVAFVAPATLWLVAAYQVDEPVEAQPSGN